MPRSSPIYKTQLFYWLVGAIALLLTAIWVGRGIASIGNLDSSASQRTKLISQFAATLKEEDRRQGAVDGASIGENRSSMSNLMLSPTEIEDSALTQDLSTNSSLLSLDHPLTAPSSISNNINPSTEISTTKLSSTQALRSDLRHQELLADLKYLLILKPIAEKETSASLERETQNIVQRWVEIDIQSGYSLSQIFKDLTLDPRIAVIVASRDDAQMLNKLRTGPHLKILIRGNEFLGLRYQPNLISILSVSLEDKQYRVETITRDFDINEKAVSGVITSSLHKSGADNGLNKELIYSLSSIFQWQIDFRKDLRRGDRYSLIYEERSLDGRIFSSGPILAAEFVVNGKIYRAIRHVNTFGASHYYTPEGESLDGLFLRSPMRIPRVTSTFSNRRYHPVLKKWRAHKGVDYGGRVGEPVMSTADGKVSFAGWKNQYGNVIILQHGKKYSTLYAHLSRFATNVRSGSNVNQGQIIGYVGTSGLATGPHLHYEFRVNGVHKNPLTVKLPRSFAIGRSDREDFLKNATSLATRLDRIALR